MLRRTGLFGIILGVTLVSSAFASAEEAATTHRHENMELAQTTQPTTQPTTEPAEEAPGVTHAVALLIPTEGNAVSGTVTFIRSDDGIAIVANVSGLTPGHHGFHIHQYGDCSAPDGTSAGGHYNPHADAHGGPQAEQRHVGDMGNLIAGEDGMGTLEYTDSTVSFEGENSILGRGVIVHAGEDDLTTQPTGAAGARVACGVIGVVAN